MFNGGLRQLCTDRNDVEITQFSEVAAKADVVDGQSEACPPSLCQSKRMVGTAREERAFAHPTIVSWRRRLGPDLRDDPSRGHLLAFGDVDRSDDAVDAGFVDVLHLHRFQRQHRLAGGDAIARLD